MGEILSFFAPNVPIPIELLSALQLGITSDPLVTVQADGSIEISKSDQLSLKLQIGQNQRHVQVLNKGLRLILVSVLYSVDANLIERALPHLVCLWRHAQYYDALVVEFGKFPSLACHNFYRKPEEMLSLAKEFKVRLEEVLGPEHEFTLRLKRYEARGYLLLLQDIHYVQFFPEAYPPTTGVCLQLGDIITGVTNFQRQYLTIELVKERSMQVAYQLKPSVTSIEFATLIVHCKERNWTEIVNIAVSNGVSAITTIKILKLFEDVAKFVELEGNRREREVYAAILSLTSMSNMSFKAEPVNHETKIEILMIRANAFEKVQKFDEMVQIYELVYKYMLNVWNPSDECFLDLKKSLADGLKVQGNFSKAWRLYEEMYIIRKNLNGVNHHLTKLCEADIKFCAECIGDL